MWIAPTEAEVRAFIEQPPNQTTDYQAGQFTYNPESSSADTDAVVGAFLRKGWMVTHVECNGDELYLCAVAKVGTPGLT